MQRLLWLRRQLGDRRVHVIRHPDTRAVEHDPPRTTPDRVKAHVRPAPYSCHIVTHDIGYPDINPVGCNPLRGVTHPATIKQGAVNGT